MKTELKPEGKFVSTRNACNQCSPLGASVVFKGIRGCVPLIHGSQGCATYIRRYLISHFKEPVDIASSSFSEETAIFGGQENIKVGIKNITDSYKPEVIGICTTCLSETIGDDIKRIIGEYQKEHVGENIPTLIAASTPSYKGSHIEGYHEAVHSVITTLAVKGKTKEQVNIFPGFVSPEDIRNLKDILDDFGIKYIMVPDYSDSLDNPTWDKYLKIPEGGTSIEELRSTGSSKASIEFGYVLNRGGISGRVNVNAKTQTGAEYLEQEFGIKRYNCGFPIGVEESDKFFKILSEISGKEIPKKYIHQRGRLVDSYIDAHKHLFGKKAVIYGEEDLVVGMAQFLSEIGIDVVLAASGGDSTLLETTINELTNHQFKNIITRNNIDFEGIGDIAKNIKPDLFIGNSKAYYITRELSIPLIRVGFPIHDRIGSQRIQHLFYEGTTQLFDRITNAIIEYKQDHSPVGYKYM